MAKKSSQRNQPKDRANPASAPKFPYTNTPAALRRFLQLVPDKPVPDKINSTLLKSWGFKDTNSHTMTRVLKALSFLDQSGQPTDKYKQFMNKTGGPAVLADAIRTVYAPLFATEHLPHTKGDDTLRNLFNIHSGGQEDAMRLQIQTFKALADHADWNSQSTTGSSTINPANTAITPGNQTTNLNGPTIHIDLHIHLPEGKTRRDYEYMFEDIARYIYGRDASNDSAK